MPKFNFVLLYVADPEKSANFYANLLGTKIIDSAPTFAMLPLIEGVMLGLWRTPNVEPKANGAPGAGEIAMTVDNNAAVDTTHADWKKRGIVIAQEPTKMDFGRTFTALDPDGHRIRVFAPGA